MKLSLEIGGSPVVPVKTGAAIQSFRVEPFHAQILREMMSTPTKARMYDAAVTTNLNKDFAGTYGNANAEILASLYITRARSRTLAKDYATVKGILRTKKDNVAGDDPFRLEMEVGKRTDGKLTLETETNREIQQAWMKAGRPEFCTVRRDMSRVEMYHCAVAAINRDGGFILRHRRGFNNRYGYAVQLIEIDRLDVSYMGRNPETGNVIRFSIERDEFDAPVAYWILTRHPGDLFQYNGVIPNKWRERVLAKDIILFQNMRDRAEQDIGFPELDSVLQELHRNRQFEIAHVTAAIRAACKAFFIKQEFPTGMPYAGDPSENWNPVGAGSTGSASPTGNLPQGDEKGGGVDKVNVLEPGSGEVLRWGQTPVLLDPKFPVESAKDFTKNRLEAVGIGVGLSYPAVSGDYANVSFSTARALEVPQRDHFKVEQEHMIQNLVFQYFSAWLEYAILSGQVKQPISRLEEFIDAAKFNGKRWGYINPLQDAQTDVILIEAGLQSPQMAVRDNGGGDLESIYSQSEEANEMQKKHNLNFDSDPTQPVLKKGAAGEVTPTAQNQPAPSEPSRTMDDLTLEELTLLRQAAKGKRRQRIERRTFEILQSNGH